MRLWNHIRKFVKCISGKLFYEFIFILILMAFLICTAFFATEYIVKYIAAEQYRQSIEVIFNQAEERMDIYVEDIENLFMNAVYNSSVSAYYGAESLSERWDNLNGFYQVVGNNKRLNRYLENILLYNLSNELIAAQGAVFFPMQEAVEDGKLTYSDRLVDEKSGAVYFEVGMPAYQESAKNTYNRVGSVYLLFNANYLQSIVDSALPNDESTVAILDKESTPLVVAGEWDDSYSELQTSKTEGENLINVCSLANTGWRMVSVVPKASMSSGITLLQMVNYSIYILMLIIIGIVVVFIYFRIIKPISRQTAFVSNYTKDVGQRIRVTGNNEISELAGKMNEMLDDIEALNEQVINTHKQYLELEYAKKNTEMIAYRSQINPHFLYNTFNCIRGMALYRGEKDIADLTMALSGFFRYSIHGDEIVTVEEVLQNLQNYTKIIDYRFNGKHKVKIEAAVETLQKRLPKMLIQPLVENAVLHGLEPRRTGDVEVNLRLEGQCLLVCVRDEGQGIDSDTLDRLRMYMRNYDETGAIQNEDIGIGVLNVYRRFRLFYGQQGVFEIDSVEGKGTCVKLLFPADVQTEQTGINDMVNKAVKK